MKLVVPHLLVACAAALALVSPVEQRPQQPLVDAEIMAEQLDKVPGHSDAVYAVVPKEDQLFKIEYLDIAPTPIVPDRRFFVYLVGSLPSSSETGLDLSDDGLKDATVTLSSSVTYANGDEDEERSVTVPLQAMDPNDLAHLAIRDGLGKPVEFLPKTGGSLLLDFQIPTMFLKSGTWTFKVDARLGDKDNTCLFAMSLTQWLDGHAK